VIDQPPKMSNDRAGKARLNSLDKKQMKNGALTDDGFVTDRLITYHRRMSESVDQVVRDQCVNSTVDHVED